MLNRKLKPRMFSSRRLRRGSTILLVIAILSMLALLAILLTFTSRVEMSSASNAAFGAQNRIAARTGTVPVSFALLSSLPAGPTSSLNLALNEQALSASGLATNNPANNVRTTIEGKQFAANQVGELSRMSAKTSPSITGNPDLQPVVLTKTSEVVILDVAGLLNINTASVQMMERFFTAANRELKLNLSATALAQKIAAERLGADSAPGFAGVDDDFDAPEAISPTNLDEDLTLNGKSLNALSTGSELEYYDAFSKAKQSETEAALAASVDPLGNYYAGDLEKRQAARLAISTGVDEADEFVGDFRRVPYGDDRRFSSLDELLSLPGARSLGLTEDSLQALAPFITLLSASEDQLLINGELEELVDLNRATAEELFAGFQRLYGTEKNERLLMQFAVNLVDSRDTDSVPTVYPGTSGSSIILGLERTPVLTEVYADARTPEEGGDDGQFVEIYNPWNEPLSLEGFRLRGAGLDLQLTGTLPVNGFLIVTDDATGQEDAGTTDDLPGTGSLYDIFGILPNGGNQRVIQFPQFALSDKGTGLTVELLDDESRTVDSFTYSALRDDEDSLYSYQRQSPLVRSTTRQQATPFSLQKFALPGDDVLARLWNAPLNGPFVNEADVLTVFAGFATAMNSEGNSQFWSFPVLGTPRSLDNQTALLAENPDNIDARVLDLLALFPQERGENQMTNRNGQGDLEESLRAYKERIEKPAYDEAAASLLEEEDYETFTLNEWIRPFPGISQDRINVNTAPAIVLESIPGINSQVARALVEKRLLQENAVREGKSGASTHLFGRQSDLLIDDLLFPRELSEEQRLDLLRGMLPCVAFNSRTFRVLSQPRKDETTNSEGDQLSNAYQALIATDRKKPEILRISKFQP